MKCRYLDYHDHSKIVAPARERGLKFRNLLAAPLSLGRSRKGAWIEMSRGSSCARGKKVAPARERGLKCIANEKLPYEIGRSRKGAWIEISEVIK